MLSNLLRNFDLFKIFGVFEAAQNLIKLYLWAVEDGKLSAEEMSVLVTHGMLPLAEALGYDFDGELPDLDTLPPDAKKMIDFAMMQPKKKEADSSSVVVPVGFAAGISNPS